MLDWQPKAPYTAEQLLEILRILRDPENGCPWDKVQTHASIRKNFLEETCEVLEAIDADDPVLMQEELGDVLMQVAFHAVMEEERGHFTFEDVCREVCEKLVFRHPNIFASSAAQNAGINGWDALKNKEKGRTTLADELGTVPATEMPVCVSSTTSPMFAYFRRVPPRTRMHLISLAPVLSATFR